jgi:hypothetical protein
VFIFTNNLNDNTTDEEENQLDATQYFIALEIGSACFGHRYAHRQELWTIPLSYHMRRLTPWLLVVGGQVQGGWISVRAENCSPQPEHLASHPPPDRRPPAAKVSDGACGNSAV